MALKNYDTLNQSTSSSSLKGDGFPLATSDDIATAIEIDDDGDFSSYTTLSASLAAIQEAIADLQKVVNGDSTEETPEIDTVREVLDYFKEVQNTTTLKESEITGIDIDDVVYEDEFDTDKEVTIN